MKKETCLLVAVMLFGCSPAADQLTERQEAINIVTDFMRTGDTTGLQDAFGDSVLSAYSSADMVNARTDMINSLGEFQGAKGLHFHSDSESHVTFGFEHGDLNFTFVHDRSGRIAVFSDEEPDTELSADAQSATNGVSLTDLASTDELRASFDSDSQFVRLVSLLSPT